MGKAIQAKEIEIKLFKPSKQSMPIIKQDKVQHKWNRAKLQVGQNFSGQQYMLVEAIQGNVISLKNERGEKLKIDLAIL